MSNPTGFTIENMTDVLAQSDVTYRVEVDTDDHQALILVIKDADNNDLGQIVIENHLGDLNVLYWNRQRFISGDVPGSEWNIWKGSWKVDDAPDEEPYLRIWDDEGFNDFFDGESRWESVYWSYHIDETDGPVPTNIGKCVRQWLMENGFQWQDSEDDYED